MPRENAIIDDYLEDLAYLSDEENTKPSDKEDKRASKKNRMSKLLPFYQTRNDIFGYFSEDRIMKTFRFDRDSIQFILGLIQHLLPKMKIRNTRNLEPIDMLLIALQFYATGSFQTVVGNILRYSQSSVCRSIARVSLALCMISNNHIQFPATLFQVKKDFHEIARMPGVVGCIDGTHIRIVRPKNHEKAYVNRKNYRSLNVQAICDANHRFLSVCANKPGSCHDSSIFKGSLVYKRFINGEFKEGFLLGDSGYANTNFLITPYAEPVTQPEIRFNNSHKSTRCTIERSFGLLKKRFYVLHSEIRMSPTKASWITVACCLLHNIAIDRKMPLDEDSIELEIDNVDNTVGQCKLVV